MAFWSRLRQSQLKTLSNHIKKCHLQSYYTSNALNHSALLSRIGIINNPNFAIQKSQFEFPNNVRFFAAPVQAKKKEEKDTGGPRLNEKITAPVVRLVSDEGHSVVSRYEALERAKRLKLDLVEVQRNSQPPVCKLMDYHKEKYKQQQQIKDKGRSKSKSDVKKGIVKEVRFSGQISQNDLQLKADTVKRLLEEGYRVKCMVTRKKDEDLGKLLARFLGLIEDISMVENGPRVEEQQAHLILRHVKLGPSKKGSGKKASKATESASANSQNAAAASTVRPSSGSTIQLGETFDASESCSENEDGVISADVSDDDSENNVSNWTAFDSNDDFDRVFDVGDGVDGVMSSNEKEFATTPESLFSPANRSTESMNPRSSIDLARTHTASTTFQAPLGTENRYSREPRNSSQPAQSMDGNGPGAKNSRLKPPFVDLGRQQQFNINASPQKREAVQREAQASGFSNTNFPANSFSKENSSGSSTPSSAASGFGVFSAPRAESTIEKQNVQTEVNRYKKGNAPDPARSSSSMGFSADRNSPMSNSKSRGPSIDKDGQGKFGIFSPKSSNAIPNRNSENQVKVER